jgi:hypothetical protein
MCKGTEVGKQAGSIFPPTPLIRVAKDLSTGTSTYRVLPQARPNGQSDRAPKAS